MNLIDIINTNLHYIGEILVVVFGVLIAFFISNFSEERKRRKRIKQILEIVKLNFRTDIEAFEKEITILNEKERIMSQIIDPNINNKTLSDDDKLKALFFLFDHPSINIQKEGYYLLKDADFNYDAKKNKLVSEIITMYSSHIGDIERERDRVIRTSEMFITKHMQDPWLAAHQSTKEGRQKILSYLESYINSDEFVNELDYMGQCVFGNYKITLEKYIVVVREFLEKLKQ